MSDNLIVCQGLVKSYGHKAALTGIDLEVGRGRIAWACWAPTAAERPP